MTPSFHIVVLKPKSHTYSPNTFIDNTKTTLSNFLPNPIMHTNNIGGMR
jgi:hypothetical protein